jgi:hypothetical protein
MPTISSGDVVSFLGAMLGAGLTVLGSLWVLNRQTSQRAVRDRNNLLSFLAILEGRWAFTRSESELSEFVAGRDVPGLINRCALILEMADLLNSPAVAEAAVGYRQLYALHRLRRVLKVWSPAFEPYADIPYTDFYTLAEPEAFEAVVSELFVPAAIIRGSVHLYIAEITGRNLFLEEIETQHGTKGSWDPDAPFIPHPTGGTPDISVSE